jgi:hypothetical protein
METFNISSVRDGLQETRDFKYHRGKSWEFCYSFFRGYETFRDDDGLVDQAALHLGFYLASWGMFRGSSFLLQADYKYFRPIIEVLLKDEYDTLWKADVWTEDQAKEQQEKNLTLVFKLKTALRDVMEKEKGSIYKEPSNKRPWNITETQVTKIIMGTMGCVPAYDQFFKKGIILFSDGKNLELELDGFHPESFKNLLNLSTGDDTLSDIYKVQMPIGTTGFIYPPMKLLDLYFWLRGYNNT